MAPRPRNKKNKGLTGTPYLYYSERTGYQLKLVNNKRVRIGRDKQTAIMIANEYNARMRGDMEVIDRLVSRSGPSTSEPPFSSYLDAIHTRIISEENLGRNALSTLANDIERAKEYFSMPAYEISLETVNGYIREYHSESSNNVVNRKLSFLEKIFKYAIDDSCGGMRENPASLKMRKPKDKKMRQRLKLEWYNEIHKIAPLWLQTAMDLSLQTTHAVLEISRIERKLPAAPKRPNRCGCVWFKQPIDGIYGTLYIHRQKTGEKEAAHVAIPIGNKLKQIIDRSTQDNVLSPFVVHRLPKKQSNQTSALVTHKSQLTTQYISTAFSHYRDISGVCDHLEKSERPTFHEIRALAARLLQDQGINPQARMAHSDEKSTKIYTENHVQWVEVPHMEIG